MEELKIVDLYQKTPDKTLTKFKNKTNSTLKVTSDYELVDSDTEWITIMEDTIRYIDNILRNPNRFIVNEEDIVKIELARRVTVESIKHLSRNTNLIQDYDKKTGDVKPSKILNINKEESYNTYENRFVYSLIQNMKGFIARKKSMGIKESSLRNDKVMEYNASSKLGDEQINVSMKLNSKLHSNTNRNSDGLTIPERIEKLELQISDLTNSEVYKTLAKLHVALVTSPIKKTNVILKNVNFQYALKLWNYMQENLDDHTKHDKKKQDYQDNGELKDYVDETFLLNYLVMNTLNKDNNIAEEERQELSEKIIGNMVEKVMDLNSSLTEEQLKNIVAKQYQVIKYKQVTSTKRLIEIFDNKIDKYLKSVNNLKI